ncbi:MAG: G5 domain-containing protein [Clostridia bacterium]|nr:G5 domain-containing protein [Clostridia bacterium]
MLKQKGCVDIVLHNQTLKKLISKRNILVTFSTLVILMAVTSMLFGFVVTKDVTLVIGEENRQVTTSRVYVEEFLAEQGIVLNAGDRISAPLHSFLRNNATIVVERAKKIVLTVDGVTRDIYSCEPILADALAECGVTVGEHDEMLPWPDTPVKDAMNARIYRVKVTEEKRVETKPYNTIVIPNYDKFANHSVPITEGKDGTCEVTYKVTTKDGEEIGREAVSETILVAPVDAVVEEGVQGNKIVTASTSELKVKKVIDCTATAYSYNVGNRTASGRPANYGVIAVDPRVIPLGSKLYIESPDGAWVYGYAVAGDTGGAIKGNRIDLFYNTTSECYKFGRRTARVYVLE